MEFFNWFWLGLDMGSILVCLSITFSVGLFSKRENLHRLESEMALVVVVKNVVCRLASEKIKKFLLDW
jgi:hypothetical protein